jgi:hypothetical protein
VPAGTTPPRKLTAVIVTRTVQTGESEKTIKRRQFISEKFFLSKGVLIYNLCISKHTNS